MSHKPEDFKTVECENCDISNLYVEIATLINGNYYCDDCAEEYREQLAQIIIESKF